VQLHHGRDPLLLLRQQRVQRIGLRHRAREAVQDEAVLAVPVVVAMVVVGSIIIIIVIVVVIITIVITIIIIITIIMS
jgi:hypothetical protein